MQTPAYAIGQAVFIRTDTPDYAEETMPFKNLEEMVKVCTSNYANMVLEKVVVYSMVGGDPVQLTLGFVASSKGMRPPNLDTVENEG